MTPKSDSDYIQLDTRPPSYKKNQHIEAIKLDVTKANKDQSSSNLKPSIWGDVIYCTLTAIILFIFSVNLMYLPNFFRFIGFFMLPYSIFLGILVNGIIVFRVEDKIGTAPFFKLLEICMLFIFVLSLVLTKIILFFQLMNNFQKRMNICNKV